MLSVEDIKVRETTLKAKQKRLKGSFNETSTTRERNSSLLNNFYTKPQKKKKMNILEGTYHKEAARLESFRNWSVQYISKYELAKYGFYYIGPDDMVKCHFCKAVMGLWEPYDSILSEHLRWSPYCPLLRKRPTSNIPLDPHFLDHVIDPAQDSTGIMEEYMTHFGFVFDPTTTDSDTLTPVQSPASTSTTSDNVFFNDLGKQQDRKSVV